MTQAMSKFVEKYGAPLAVGLSLLVISWGIWVTTTLSDLRVIVEAGKQLRVQQYATLCDDMATIKSDFKSLQSTVITNNEKVLEKLAEIQSKLRK